MAHNQQIEHSLQKALEEIKTLKSRLVADKIFFKKRHIPSHRFENIIGQSDGLQYVLYRAEQVAPTDTTVLVLGETGTGKELLAEAIHQLSPRRDRSLITVNCAILGASLFMIIRDYTLIQSIGYGAGSGVGWLLAISLVGAIREKIQATGRLPSGLEGPGITLIITGLLSLAFTAFSGLIKIQ